MRTRRKEHNYDERIRNVEFTSLVFSVAGDMGPIATTFYQRLASMLSDKLHQTYMQSHHLLDSLQLKFFPFAVHHNVLEMGA